MSEVGRTPPSPRRDGHPVATTVLVDFVPGFEPPFRDGSGANLPDHLVAPWAELVATAGPGLLQPRLGVLFGSHPPSLILEQFERAARLDPRFDAAAARAQFAVHFPDERGARRAVQVLSGWTRWVRRAAIAPRSEPASFAPSDPDWPKQEHLGWKAAGIAAEAAWARAGGDGAGVGFVDVEYGWDLGHPDLAHSAIQLIFGTPAGPANTALIEHGTNVLGVVLANANTINGIGVAPAAGPARVAAAWTLVNLAGTLYWVDVLGAAVVAAALDASTKDGDVILVEAQTAYAIDASGATWREMPAETRGDVFLATLLATILGRIVVEPAGNGGNDLNGYRDPFFGPIFDLGTRDSGAIVVGAGWWDTGKSTHRKVEPGAPGGWGTNRGSRVDCFARGIDVTTLSTTGGGTKSQFEGTSPAAAIVAGAIVVLQGMALQSAARAKRPFRAAELRAILREPAHGVPPDPPSDASVVGRMPRLDTIVARTLLDVPPVP